MRDSGGFINQGKIRVICGMPVNSLIGFEFSAEPNVHAEARLRVLPEDTGEAAELMLERTCGEAVKVVEVSADGEEKFPPLFAGIILSGEISHEGGSREAYLCAVSGSILLDRIKKSRSYQDTGMSYEEIIRDLLKDTEASALLYFAEKKMLEKPVIQYRETDFSFAVRMASHQNTCIYPDISASMPRLTYGLPKGRDRGEISVDSCRMGMDSCHHKKTDKKEALLFCEITCKDSYDIGDTVWLQGRRLRVCSKKGTLQRGLLYFRYTLAGEAWTWHEKIYHSLFPGISLKGTVLECRQEYVKLHLDLDPVQDVEKAYPFLWKPETGNLMYCMPEVGTKVYLNIGDREEGNACAVGCIRTNGEVCPETHNPDKRFWSNEFGKKVKLHPDLLEFQGRGEDGSDSALGLGDNGGVSVRTNRTFAVKAAGGVRLGGKKVTLSASQEFTAVKKDLLSPTVMNLNHTIDLLGGKGKIASSGREAEPLSQGKRIENYDISDIEERILSSIPQEEEDELSAVLAAGFVSTLYSEK